jgi:hypothetical protein
MNLAIWLLERANSAEKKVRHPIFNGVRDDL